MSVYRIVTVAAVVCVMFGCGRPVEHGVLETVSMLTGEGYTKGLQGVCWGRHKVPGADSSTFEWLHGPYGHPFPWGRDAEHGYYRNLRIEGSHGPSFEVMTTRWARDKKHVYRGTQKSRSKPPHWRIAAALKVETLDGADPATFRLLQSETHSNYVADKNHVYYRLDLIEHADPATFRRMEGSPLWRDDRFLFRMAKRVETTIAGKVIGANANNWRRIEGSKHNTDGVGVWRSSGNSFTPIPDADPSTFQELSSGFTKDAHHVWHCSKLIAGVDAESFRVNEDRSIEDVNGKIGPDRDPRNVRGRPYPVPKMKKRVVKGARR